MPEEPTAEPAACSALTRDEVDACSSASASSPSVRRLLIFTVGSWGDVQPYAALTHRLRSRALSAEREPVARDDVDTAAASTAEEQVHVHLRAHAAASPAEPIRYVTAIATHACFRDRVLEFADEFYELPGDPRALANAKELLDALYDESPLKIMRVLGAAMDLPAVADAVVAAFDAFAPTCVLAHNAIVYMPMSVCEQRRIPVMMGSPMPAARSSKYAPVMMRARPLRCGCATRLLHSVMQWLLWARERDTVIKMRRERLALTAPVRHWVEDVPACDIYSEAICPRAPEWPAHVEVVGFVQLPDAVSGWKPSAALQRFVDAGDAPVYVGFGSMPIRNPQQYVRAIIDGVRAVGRRLVLCSGWTSLSLPDDTGPDVLLVNEVSHDWLFPRCAVVVHHGGSGSLHTSLRAGVPTVVYPLFVDQPFWAARVVDLGVGARSVIPLTRLNASNLAAQLRDALQPSVRERARALGERIRAERGLDGFADFVDRYGGALHLYRDQPANA